MDKQIDKDYAVKGVDAHGKQVWYTGRAGDQFISYDRNDAYLGFSAEGASHKATVLNRGTAFHGVRFSADI